jgi:hypothetical protein
VYAGSSPADGPAVFADGPWADPLMAAHGGAQHDASTGPSPAAVCGRSTARQRRGRGSRCASRRRLGDRAQRQLDGPHARAPTTLRTTATVTRRSRPARVVRRPRAHRPLPLRRSRRGGRGAAACQGATRAAYAFESGGRRTLVDGVQVRARRGPARGRRNVKPPSNCGTSRVCSVTPGTGPVDFQNDSSARAESIGVAHRFDYLGAAEWQRSTRTATRTSRRSWRSRTRRSTRAGERDAASERRTAVLGDVCARLALITARPKSQALGNVALVASPCLSRVREGSPRSRAPDAARADDGEPNQLRWR